jgi:hypothetical protein
MAISKFATELTAQYFTFTGMYYDNAIKKAKEYVMEIIKDYNQFDEDYYEDDDEIEENEFS